MLSADVTINPMWKRERAEPEPQPEDKTDDKTEDEFDYSEFPYYAESWDSHPFATAL